MTVKCGRNMIVDNCGNHNCKQCWTGDRFDCWNNSKSSWWVTEYKKIIVAVILKLLIIKYTAEKRDMFYIYSLIVNLNVKFIYEICLNYEFDEFKDYQWLNLIKKALNKDYFENFIVEVVMLNDNVQKFSIVFLKTNDSSACKPAIWTEFSWLNIKSHINYLTEIRPFIISSDDLNVNEVDFMTL